MTKRQKITTLILIAVVCLIFAGYMLFTHILVPDTKPEIFADSDEITVSVKDDTGRLMEGIRASDAEDGDLTDKIILESVSKFIRRGECNATYAVVDSDNNVTKLTRKVIYSDYKKPRMSLSGPLVFDYGYAFNILEPLGAEDCFDGDISDKVKMVLLGEDEYISSAGFYKVNYSVTNSFGDTVSLELPVRILQRTSSEIRYQPVIGMENYLVYIKKGDEFDPRSYIKSITVNTEELELTDEIIQDVMVDSRVNTEKAGMYEVRYDYKAENGYIGTTILTVVVEE